MNKQDRHEKILLELEDLYVSEGFNQEFLIDGPSHWDKYESSRPRIVFLAKEAYSSCNHSTPSLVTKTRFSRIVANWASIIKSTLKIEEQFESLQDAWNSIAIVNVKKIDDDKQRSTHPDLKKFVWLGKDYLKKQINLLDPHIIVCLGIEHSIEYYDIIYNYDSSLEEIKSREKKLYSNLNCTAWLSNNFIILQTYHPIASKNKNELKDSIRNIFLNPTVRKDCYKTLNSK